MKIPLAFILLLLIPFATAIDYAPNNALNPTGAPVNTIIVPSDDPVWSYESIGLYEAHFMDDSSSGQIVRFESGGAYITLQPMALNWRNDLNQLEQISMIQNVAGTPNNNRMTYLGAYGATTHLEYIAEETTLKENIKLENKPPEPAQYIIDGGNAFLETNFILGTNAFTIEIDGEAWNKQTATATSSEVLIKNADGDTLYKLPPPIAIDASGDSIIGTYEFKKSGVTLYISHRTPKSWLDTASYPVTIDPSFEVDYSPVPGELLSDANVWTDDDSAFNTTIVTTEVSDDDDLTHITTDIHKTHTVETIDYTDGIFEASQTITIGDIAAVDFTLPNMNEVLGITLCFYASQKKSTPPPFNITNGLTSLGSIILPVLAVPNTYTCFIMDTDDFHTGVNRIGLQTVDVTGGQSGVIGQDTTSPNSTSYFWNGIWNLQTSFDYGIKLYYIHADLDSGAAFSGHWTQTYDPLYNWFLKVRKLTALTTEATVLGYSNLTNLIPQQNTTVTLNGQGWFYIPVDDILNYEKNTASMNFSHLRFFTFEPTEFSEFRLTKETNDTAAPNITDCTVDNNNLTCGETARYTCNVTDDLGVANVTFIIDGNPQAATKMMNDIWYYDLTPTTNGTFTFTLENVIATDIFSQTSNATQNISVDFECITYLPPSIINCLYNPEPFTTIEQDFICTITQADNKTFHCYGITKHPDDDSVFDITPRQENIPAYGTTTGYQAKQPLAATQLVKVSFSTKRLTTTQAVVFQALCVNDLDPTDKITFNRTLTPRFTTPNIIGEAAYSGTKNAGYYAMLIAGLFIGLLVLFMIVRELKRR